MATVNTFNIGNVVLPGDGYPPLAAFKIPVTLDLVSALFLGHGKSLITKDFAPGGGRADIFGSPVAAAGYTSLSGTSYLQTKAVETAAMSFLIVARKTDAALSSGFIGNLIQGTPGGIGIYSNANADSVMANASRAGTTSGVTAAVPATPTAWGMYSLVVPATGQMRLRNHTTGAGASNASSAAREVKGGRINVGGIPYSTIQGPNQMSLPFIWKRAISDTELDQMVAYARALVASVGITV